MNILEGEKGRHRPTEVTPDRLSPAVRWVGSLGWGTTRTMERKKSSVGGGVVTATVMEGGVAIGRSGESN